MTEPKSGFRYKAFISYSWKDKNEAGELHRALEAFRTPKALIGRAAANGAIPERLAPVFRDRDEEAAGASLKAAIEDGLDNSEFLIIVCSPNAAASPWVNKEIAYFRKKRTPNNILTYVIAGEPGPHCFAPALLFDSTVDGEISDRPIEQPLAADAREDGDGKRLARLKIAAAMLGVGLDDLVRRDAQRRARRLRYALAGVSAVALGFAGVAATAVFQWRQAVANEQRATREAMKASRTAEFMVALFEVPDPSESRGREVTAREILDKGVKTIEKDLADEPDVQATLMYTMGRTYTGLGLYPDAVRILTVARDKRTAIKADPDDVFATENALARAEFEKGDLDAAKKIYSKLVAEADADTAAGKWRVDYATAYIGMGETTLYKDTPQEAQNYYERARDLLAKHGMGESEEMAEALRGLGGAFMDHQRPADAKITLINAISVELRSPTPSKLFLAELQNDLANAYYFNKEFVKARSALANSLTSTSEILEPDHPQILIIENNLARLEYETGDLAAASARILRIIQLFRKTRRDHHFDFLFPLSTAASIELDLGHLENANRFTDELLTLPGVEAHRMFGPSLLDAAREKCEQGNTVGGLMEIEQGRKILSRDYNTANWRFGVANEYESRCRARAGDSTKAQQLAEAGYRALRTELGGDHFFTQRAMKWRDGLHSDGAPDMSAEPE